MKKPQRKTDLSDKLVVLVDDKPEVTGTWCDVFEDFFGCLVQSYNTLQEAYEAIRGGLKYDLLIADKELNPGNGIELIRQSKEINPRTPTILLSGYDSIRCEHADLVLEKHLGIAREPILTYLRNLLTTGRL